jgi:hypothetical protein
MKTVTHRKRLSQTAYVPVASMFSTPHRVSAGYFDHTRSLRYNKQERRPEMVPGAACLQDWGRLRSPAWNGLLRFDLVRQAVFAIDAVRPQFVTERAQARIFVALEALLPTA